MDKLVELIKFLQGEGIEYFLFGGGSNLLINDEGFRGVVIEVKDSNLEIKDNIIEVCGGCTMAEVLQQGMAAGLVGFEWTAGLPGTIGGGVYGNAACYGHSLADVVERVEVYRDGEIFSLENSDCNFSNKESIFKHNDDIILKVWLKLKMAEDKEERIESKKQMLAYIKQRTKLQPNNYPSAGCAFKNYVVNEEEKAKLRKIVKEEKILNILESYNKMPVGWMVDQVGMKGKQIGGAKVSDQHANFIINVDKATAQDILTLVEEIKEKVYAKFGVNIEEEIKIL